MINNFGGGRSDNMFGRWGQMNSGGQTALSNIGQNPLDNANQNASFNRTNYLASTQPVERQYPMQAPTQRPIQEPMNREAYLQNRQSPMQAPQASMNRDAYLQRTNRMNSYRQRIQQYLQNLRQRQMMRSQFPWS
jgi:hypothetical protein